MSPKAKKILLDTVREQTGLKHLLSMDELECARLTVFQNNSNVESRFLDPKFPKKEDFPASASPSESEIDSANGTSSIESEEEVITDLNCRFNYR